MPDLRFKKFFLALLGIAFFYTLWRISNKNQDPEIEEFSPETVVDIALAERKSKPPFDINNFDQDEIDDDQDIDDEDEDENENEIDNEREENNNYYKKNDIEIINNSNSSSTEGRHFNHQITSQTETIATEESTEGLMDGNCPRDYPIKASYVTGRYYLPSDKGYKKTEADLCFAKVSAAQAAGFKPAE